MKLPWCVTRCMLRWTPHHLQCARPVLFCSLCIFSLSPLNAMDIMISWFAVCHWAGVRLLSSVSVMSSTEGKVGMDNASRIAALEKPEGVDLTSEMTSLFLFLADRTAATTDHHRREALSAAPGELLFKSCTFFWNKSASLKTCMETFFLNLWLWSCLIIFDKRLFSPPKCCWSTWLVQVAT